MRLDAIWRWSSTRVCRRRSSKKHKDCGEICVERALLPAGFCAAVRKRARVPALHNTKVWLFANRGLRGRFQALSGARNRDLVALETWFADDESTKRLNNWRNEHGGFGTD